MRMLILNADDADLMRKAGRGTLDPREIAAGKYAGSFALPARVKDDPDHEDVLGALNEFPEIDFNVDTAWPPTKE